MLSESVDRVRLPWDACYNIRELGGYPTRTGTPTQRGALLRADDLCRLTDTGQAALLAYGVRTIIDLRSLNETSRAQHPFAPGAPRAGTLTYVNLPLLDDTDHAGMAELDSADSVIMLNRVMLDRWPTRIGAILRAIARAEPGGVLFHCYAGKDRTGLIAAFALTLADVAEAVVIEDYAASDRYLQPLYARMLTYHADNPQQQAQLQSILNTPPAGMAATLAHLAERYGGVGGYLAHAGVSAEDQARIRTRLIAEC